MTGKEKLGSWLVLTGMALVCLLGLALPGTVPPMMLGMIVAAAAPLASSGLVILWITRKQSKSELPYVAYVQEKVFRAFWG